MDDGPRAKAGAFDLLRLIASLGAGKLRGRRNDPAATITHWAREVMQRKGGADLDIGIPGRTIELVGNRQHSAEVLSGRPGIDGYQAGDLKTSGMSFLAPGALTVANGDAWLRLRPFNEHVLDSGRPHQFSQVILDHVRSAFAQPAAGVDDIRAAMGRAMVKIVIGDVPPGEPDPAADVTSLFNAVQSPLRRKLFAFLYRGRRERLYALLGRTWDRAPDAATERTLLSLARQSAPAADRQTLLEQVPHWMFTFTGSGTDLLTRTLALITSRPDVHTRVREEIGAAGPADRAETVGRLAYLEACLLETGRLFPPVTRTFHKQSADSARREVVHYFPLLQRDGRLGPTVNDFHPERWLAPELDDVASASNLFLRGPRACPGMDLILFVCKSAAALQLGELGLSARQDALSSDPLPVSFPGLEGRFTAGAFASLRTTMVDGGKGGGAR